MFLVHKSLESQLVSDPTMTCHKYLFIYVIYLRFQEYFTGTTAPSSIVMVRGDMTGLGRNPQPARQPGMTQTHHTALCRNVNHFHKLSLHQIRVWQVKYFYRLLIHQQLWTEKICPTESVNFKYRSIYNNPMVKQRDSWHGDQSIDTIIVQTYSSASRTQKESMKGKLPAIASNSPWDMKPSLSWS